MKALVLTALVATTFIFSPAQAAPAGKVDPEAAVAVKEMLHSMNYREMMRASFAELQKAMPGLMLQGVTAAIENNSALNAKQKRDAMAKASKDVPAAAAMLGGTLSDPKVLDELIDETIPLYARHFTVPEIKQLDAFYKTPIGKKMIVSMPSLLNESMQISQRVLMPRMNAAIGELARKQ